MDTTHCIAISSWGGINVTCLFDILSLCLHQSCFTLLATASHRELMLSCFAHHNSFEHSSISSTACQSAIMTYPLLFTRVHLFIHFRCKQLLKELPNFFIEINHSHYLLHHSFLSSLNLTNNYTLSRLQIRILYSIWSRTDCTGTSFIVWWFIITFFWDLSIK